MVCLQGYTSGSIIFLSNATTWEGAEAAADTLTLNTSTQGRLLVSSVSVALTSWLSTSAAAYSTIANLTVPSGFNYTRVTMTDVVISSAVLLPETIEETLGLNNDTAHYAIEVIAHTWVSEQSSPACTSTLTCMALVQPFWLSQATIVSVTLVHRCSVAYALTTQQ